jgi:lactate dehydrogenase-like 2-hydroxyacid dehydrogenase
MLDAVEKGSIGGAALDVFADVPQINQRFLKLDNVLLQLHQASGTIETRKGHRTACVRQSPGAFRRAQVLTPVL